MSPKTNVVGNASMPEVMQDAIWTLGPHSRETNLEGAMQYVRTPALACAETLTWI